MKLSKKIMLSIIVLCTFPMFVNAASYYGVVTGAGVRIRKDPSSTNYYKMASSGEILTVLDPNVVAGNDACPNGWYKVDYNSNTGYFCSDYIKVYEKSADLVDNATPSNECEAQLSQAGFPSSYWSGLCALKSGHSNWEFIAVNKDANGNAVDWNMSVNAEASCGMNTISSNATDSYKNPYCTKKTDT